MKRREVLAAVGVGMAATAGCIEINVDGDDDDSSSSGRPAGAVGCECDNGRWHCRDRENRYHGVRC